MLEKSRNLLEALEYAIKVIENYELDCRNLSSYIKDGYSIKGFCQGRIYKEAIGDTKRIAGIKVC